MGCLKVGNFDLPHLSWSIYIANESIEFLKDNPTYKKVQLDFLKKVIGHTKRHGKETLELAKEADGECACALQRLSHPTCQVLSVPQRPSQEIPTR